MYNNTNPHRRTVVGIIISMNPADEYRVPYLISQNQEINQAEQLPLQLPLEYRKYRNAYTSKQLEFRNGSKC